MQTQPTDMLATAKKRASGTCRKCWNALGESESCATCGETFARVQWLIWMVVMVGVVVAGGLYSLL